MFTSFGGPWESPFSCVSHSGNNRRAKEKRKADRGTRQERNTNGKEWETSSSGLIKQRHLVGDNFMNEVKWGEKKNRI